MMNPDERIVYSISVEDIQTVANNELNRDLIPEEIKLIEDEIGDYIAWYDIVSDLIIEKNIK